MCVTDKDVKRLEKKLGYKGCKNCQYYTKPVRTCEWAKRGGDGHLHFICPEWDKKESEGKK